MLVTDIIQSLESHVRWALPVKGTGEDEVVVCREFAQAGLELALVD